MNRFRLHQCRFRLHQCSDDDDEAKSILRGNYIIAVVIRYHIIHLPLL